jgi:hypothetical protein
MIIRRTNSKQTGPLAGGNANPSPERGGAAVRIPITTVTPIDTTVPVHAGKPAGDVIYGAKAIARYLFDDDSNRSRRRVFNLWNHYRDRNERAGFFKLKGALCLSKSQWTAFHRLE